MNRLTLAALLGLAAAVPSLPAPAQERYDDADLKSLERFNFRLGGFLISEFDSTLRLDSRKVPIGTVIDLEDNLDLERETTVLRLDGFYRFNKKHRVDFGWYAFKRDGFAQVIEEIRIGDPDRPEEEIVIPVGASVSTEYELDILTAIYNWSFLNTRRYELFLGGGLNVRDTSIDIAWEGTGIEPDRVDASGTLPLPVLSFGGRWSFVPTKWQANWRFTLFALELGDYQGSLRDTALTFEHNTFRNVGFGLGLNSFGLNIEAEDTDFRGQIDSNYLGLLGYVKVYY